MRCLVAIMATAATSLGGLAAPIALEMPFERAPDQSGAFVSRGGTCHLRVEGARLLRRCGEAELAASMVGARDGAGPSVAEATALIRSQVGDGSDPAWSSVDPAWDVVRWEDAWPGVDVSLRSRLGGYERELVVDPGADPRQVVFAFTGNAELPQVMADGSLYVPTSDGPWVESAPVAWQDGPEGREHVAIAWEVLADGNATLRLGAYDATRALYIDPLIPVGGLFGETGLEDEAHDVVVAPDGTLYVTGGGYRDPSARGFTSQDAFVLAITPSGALRWVSWFGGTRDFLLDPTCTNLDVDGSSCIRWEAHPRGLGGSDIGLAIDLRGDRLLVAGHTTSSDFPATGGGRGTPFLGEAPTTRSRRDAFVAVLDTADGSLIESGYTGGDGDDLVNSARFFDDTRYAVLGRSGSALTWDANLGAPTPTGPPAGWWQEFTAVPFEFDRWQAATPRGFQAGAAAQLVEVLDLPGQSWVFGDDGTQPLRWTLGSHGGPAEVDAMPTTGRSALVDVLWLGRTAGGLERYAVVGVTNGEVGGFDGTTCATTTTTACSVGSCRDAGDAFVAILEGNRCQSVTYIGGTATDIPFAAARALLAPDRDWVVVVGRTASVDFPVRAGVQRLASGPVGIGVEAFYTVVDTATGEVRLSSYLGLRPPIEVESATSDDVATGVAITPSREAAIVGFTRTGLGEFVTEHAGHQPIAPGDNGQAFVARFPLEVADLSVELVFDPTVTETGGLATATVTVSNTGTAAANPVRIELTSQDLTLDPTGTPCTPTPTGLSCTTPGGAPLADGQRVSFPVTVGAPIGEGDYELRATISAAQPDPFPGDNSVGATLIVGGVDLALTLAPAGTASQPHIAAMDEPVPFTVEVRNLGGDPAAATVLIDSPDQPLYDLVARGYPDDCAAVGDTGLSLLCTLGPISRGTPRSLSFSVELPAGEGSFAATVPEVRDSIRARVLPAADAPEDVNLGNNSAATPVVFRRPDVMAVFESAAPRTVGWDQPVTLNVAARNLGPGAARGLRTNIITGWREGALPAGCVRRSSLFIACEAPDDAPPLAVGELYRWSVPLRTPVRPEGAAPREERIPFAVAHASFDPVSTNDMGEAVVLVGHVDVRAEPPDPVPRYRVGIPEPVSWRITNASSEPATGVRFVLRLRNVAGVELPIARVRGVNCAVAQGPTETTATCEVGSLAGGESVNATFDVRALGRGELSQQSSIMTNEPNFAGAASGSTIASTVLGPDLVGVLDIVDTVQAPIRGQEWVFSVSAENVGEGRTTAGTNFTFGNGYTQSWQFDMAVSPEPTGCTTIGGVDPLAGTIYRCASFIEPDSETPSFRVVIIPKVLGPMRVYAEAHDAQDETPTNARREHVATVRGAALRATVEMRGSNGETLTQVRPEQEFLLVVDVTNDGPASAASPHLTVSWDSATLLRRAVSTPVPDCTYEADSFTCAGPSIEAASSFSISTPMRAGRSGSSSFQVSLVELGDPGAPRLVGAFPLLVTRPDVEVTVINVTPEPPFAADAAFVATLGVRNTESDFTANNMEVTVRSAPVAGVSGCSDPVTVQRVDSSVGSCVDDGAGAWRCPIAQLIGGEMATLTVTGRSVCAGVTRLTGQLRHLVDTAPDPTPANDIAHRTIEVADPSLTVEFAPTAPEGPYTAALPVTVRVRPREGGGISAGAVVELTPPWRGGSFEVVTSAGTCAPVGDLVRCSLGAVAAGANAELTVTASAADGPVSGTLRVEATSASGTERTTGSVAMRLRGPDLALGPASAPSDLRVDDLAQWTMAVANLGTAVAEHGAVEFTFSSDQLTNFAVDGLGVCSATQSGRLCQLDEAIRAAGGAATATITGRVRRSGEVSVTARAQSKYRPDENPANDTATLTATVAAPDLAATLAFAPDVAAPGETVEARLVVVNHATVASEATSATFAFGARLGVTRTPPGCSLSQGVARCAVPPLTTGTDATFSFDVVPSAGADVVVQVAVVSTPDENPANDRASATLRIAGLDSDGDGVADSAEDAGPGGGDANGDGTPDRTQPHVAALPVASFGAVVLEAPLGTTIASFGLVTPPAPPPAGVAFPMGALTFAVSGATPGALVPLRLTFPAGVPAWAWYKYDGAWTRLDWDGTTGGRAVGPRTLELVLRDGGRGDEDGVADGTVRDPGAPGLSVLVVDDAGDAGDLVPGDGACQTVGGGCTLRAAIEEVAAATEPALVRFAFAEAVQIAPVSPLPALGTPVLLDASDVPGTTTGARGVTVSGRLLSGGPLFSVEAEGVGFVGLGVEDVAGDGVDVRAAGFRFADGALGRPVGDASAPQDWAALRAAPAAHGLAVVDSWVGSIAAGARYGVVVGGSDDALLEDLVVNLNRVDGLRPQATVPTGVYLDTTRRATVRGLRVSGAEVGLLIEGDASGTRVVGSYFGLGVDGFCHAFTRDDPGPAETGTGPCLDGNLTGLLLRGASGVTIGGLGADEGNVFGNHTGAALALQAGSSDNALHNNWFGLAADGTCQPAAPDGLCRLYTGAGVDVEDSPSNLIGATGAGNVFGTAALTVFGTGSVGNRVEGNWGGFAGDLQTPLRPGFTSLTPVPVHITGGAQDTELRDNTIGELWIGGDSGATTIGTVVSENRLGSAGDGLSLPSSASHTLYLLNAAGGLRVREGAHDTTVSDNVITSTVGWCAEVDAAVEDLVFTGNHVGLVVHAGEALPCLLGGLRLAGAPRAARIESNAFGSCAGEASPTLQSACLLLGQDTAGTIVRYNSFGVTRIGRGGFELDVLPNPVPAIILGRAPGTLVEGNTILGTAPYGLYDRAAFEGDYDAPADAPIIVGNRVGIDSTGTERGGVADHGILIVASHARVGGVGAGEGNRVFGSGGAGIAIGNVDGVVVRGNVLADNGGLGLAFSGSTIPATNDVGDGDGGPNGAQNHPLLGVYTDGPSPSVVATLSSRPSRAFTIDVYAVGAVDPSGHGEADEWLGSAELATGGDGEGSVVIALARPLALGERLTATATGEEGTSEYGPASRVAAAGIADLEVYLFAPNELLPDTVGDLQFGVLNNGPDLAQSVVVDVTLPDGWTFEGALSPPAGTCVVAANRASCSGFDVAAFDLWEVFVAVRPTGVGAYQASLRADSLQSDSAAANNAATAELLVGAVGYLLTARAQGFVSNWAVGEVVPIEAELFRNGPNRAIEDMRLTLTLPEDAAIVGGDGTCTGPGPIWTCELGTVPAPAATQVWRIDVVFGSAASGLRIPLELSSLAPNTSGPARAEVFLNLSGEPAPDLSLGLAASPATVVAGASVDLVATVANPGATASGELLLTFDLPVGADIRATDTTCVGAGATVTCVAASVPAGGDGVVTARVGAPVVPGEARACVRRLDEAAEEARCRSVGIGGSPFDIGVAMEQGAIEDLSGRPLALIALVESPTGAPSTALRWSSDGVASAAGEGCVADELGWLCEIPAMEPGELARIELRVDPAVGTVQEWTARVVAAGDSDPSNDTATAWVAASAAADCQGYEAELLRHADAAGDLSVDGFDVIAGGLFGAPAWSLAGGAGSLSTAEFVVPSDTAELRLEWLQRGAAVEEGVRSVEVSNDDGGSWRRVDSGTVDAAIGEGLAYVGLSIGAPTAGPTLVRWAAAGAGAGAWDLGALRVVACTGGAPARVDIGAIEAVVSADLGDVPVVTFEATNRGDVDLDGVTIELRGSPELSILAAEGGESACKGLPDGTLRCTVDPLAADASALVRAWVSADDEVLVTLEATLSARAVLTADSVRAATARVRFGDAAYGSSAALVWGPAALEAAPGEPAAARLGIFRDGPAGADGGSVEIVVPDGLVVTSAAPRCAGAGAVIRCLLEPNDDAPAEDDFDLNVAVAEDSDGGVLEATWVSAGDPDDVVSAQLPVTARDSGTLALTLTAPTSSPPAVDVTRITLRVEAIGGDVRPAVLSVRANDNLIVRSATGPDTDCAVRSTEVRCTLGALAQGAPRDISLDVAPRDAGLALLVAGVERGPRGAASAASLVWFAERDCSEHPCEADVCADTVCEPRTGCGATPRIGEVCDWGAACGLTGVCTASGCFGAGAVACDDGLPCTRDACSAEGVCEASPASGPCETGCTIGGWCDGSACTGGEERDCDDGDPCTAEVCVEPGGCAYEPVDSAECACRDLPATRSCEAGAFVTRDGCGDETARAVCADDDVCTADSCDAEEGCVFAPVDSPECVGCVAECDDRECGPDPVCGEDCGGCRRGEVCAFGLCIDDPCDELQAEGCCDGDVLAVCGDDGFVQLDCAEEDLGCGWSDEAGAFACGGGDPIPDDIEALCPWVPECDGDDCGPADGASDAGTGDAGMGDAGMGDAGTGDAGTGDAGADDAGDLGRDVEADAADGTDAPSGDESPDRGGLLDTPEPEGCGCQSTSPSASSPWMLTALALLGWARRRPRRR